MRVVLFGVCFLWLSHAGIAQYYLQQIIVAERAAENFALLKKLNIKKVTATSFDADGSISANFSLRQELDPKQNTLTTFAQSDFTGTSVMTAHYNDKGKVVMVIDSSSSIVNRSVYHYNEKGQLTKLEMKSADSMQTYAIEEVNIFAYNTNGNATGMTRIKNRTDTTRIVFVLLETGKPAAEQWWQNNRRTETWFYYYNDAGRLTDVARENAKAGKILPDYLFEFDEKGRLIQQTTVLGTVGGNYRIWRYVYDGRGLKIKEGIFNKQQQLEGSIEYQYQ